MFCILTKKELFFQSLFSLSFYNIWITTHNIIAEYKKMRKTASEGFVTRVMESVPGKKYFGLYRFLPFFFVLGAALEFSMINWTVGETNFYRTYKKRQALDHIELKKHDMEQ